ncbi:MAG TPA: MarR family transcriptional regulator [Galbitalea sp.]|jgi:DNA-binding MarR family transcriptional regulator|nr:MarR family transcriptional regulator [Galbitalea sp.]
MAPSADAEDLDRFVETSFAIIAQVTRVGAEYDLSLTAVRMLGILRDRVLKMAELAEYLGLERSTISGLVDRAERRGLVVRETHASDGRSTRVRLTSDGQAQVARATADLATRITPIIENSGLAPKSSGHSSAID